MKHLSLLLALTGVLLPSLTTISVQATELMPRSNLDQASPIKPAQRRWLAQYGPTLRVEPLCNSNLLDTAQLLSPGSCAALTGAYNKTVRLDARTIHIRELKRDRAFWHLISRRDQRILEQYEVVVVGEAAAVVAKTGIAR